MISQLKQKFLKFRKQGSFIMRIAFISNSIIPSRTANSIQVIKMCEAFSDQGHEVVLLAPEMHDKYEKNVLNDNTRMHSFKWMCQIRPNH